MKTLLLLITLFFTMNVSATYEKITDVTLKDVKGNSYSQNTLSFLQETAEMLNLESKLALNCDKQSVKICQIECDDHTNNVSMAMHGTDSFGQTYTIIFQNDSRVIFIKDSGVCYYRGFIPVPLLTK
jgi:hypothetical protein